MQFPLKNGFENEHDRINGQGCVRFPKNIRLLCSLKSPTTSKNNNNISESGETLCHSVQGTTCGVAPLIRRVYFFRSCDDDLSEDRDELLHGISELDITNSDCFPSQLLVHGSLAFPLGLDTYHGCVIAAARYGRGRVVVTGHKVLFTVGKLGPFLLNAVRWLDGGRKGKIVVQTELRTLSGLLAVGGIDTSIEPQLTSDASVYCFEPTSDVGIKELQEFVAEGGGLFVGAQAWWWAFKNPGVSPLARFPGNLLLNPFGISITSQSLNPGPFRTPKAGIRTYHFRSTLAEFQVIMGRKRGNVEKGWLAKLGPDGAAFLQIPAEEVPAYMSVHRLLRKLLSRYRLPVATRENPVINDCCRGAMLSLATGLAHSGSDLSLLVPEIEDMYSSLYLRPSESPITVDVNCTNPGTTAGGWKLSFMGTSKSGT